MYSTTCVEWATDHFNNKTVFQMLFFTVVPYVLPRENKKLCTPKQLQTNVNVNCK